LIKPFLSLFALLSLVVIGVLIHYINYNYTLQKKSINHIVALTSTASLSLSVGYDKPREIKGSKSNIIYPELPTTSSMGFVYAQ